MNSKQRRRFERKFKYTQTIRLYYHPLLIPWCNQQFGKDNWIFNTDEWVITTYRFKYEHHRTWFVLKWSEIL